jgi:hypothetical protein
MLLVAFLITGLASNSTTISTSISNLVVGKSNITQSINTEGVKAETSSKGQAKTKSDKSEVNSVKVISEPISGSGIKFTHGSKASWSNCKAINYILTEGTTAPQAEMVASALKTMGKSRGLVFAFSGYSKEISRANWGEGFNNGTYRPVLISFIEPSQTDMLGKNNAGGAVVNRFSDDLQLFVSGTVAINIDVYNNLEDGYSEGKSKGNLLLHEFGHLVGLDHVDDKSALMHPSISDLTENGLNSKDSDVLHTFPASCKS